MNKQYLYIDITEILPGYIDVRVKLSEYSLTKEDCKISIKCHNNLMCIISLSNNYDCNVLYDYIFSCFKEKEDFILPYMENMKISLNNLTKKREFTPVYSNNIADEF